MSLWGEAYAVEIVEGGCVNPPKAEWREAYAVGIVEGECANPPKSECVGGNEVRNILPLFSAIEALKGKDGASIKTISIVDNKIRIEDTEGRIVESEPLQFSGEIEVDDTLSEMSENPVQNKVITKEVKTIRNRMRIMTQEEYNSLTTYSEDVLYIIISG